MLAVTGTILFEKGMREQLETQEHEMREQLKSREYEIREIKLQKAISDRVVEELRPLCEELPDCALDPVTLEPMGNPIVMRCGHTFSSSTIVEIAKRNNQKLKDALSCSICRQKTGGHYIYWDQSFGETVEHLEKIKRIFEDYATKETRAEEGPTKKKSRTE